jgi:rhodanese-related sulfurtransferase
MGDGRGVDALLAAARAALGPRPGPGDLDRIRARGGLVIDTRPAFQRHQDGELPGAVVIERNHLEWRLDPSASHRIAEADSYDREIVIVCNEGYASTLAAVSLRQLGLHRATDLDGGFQAWLAVYGPRVGAAVSE